MSTSKKRFTNEQIDCAFDLADMLHMLNIFGDLNLDRIIMESLKAKRVNW